jgi:hypothetical protein
MAPSSYRSAAQAVEGPCGTDGTYVMFSARFDSSTFVRNYWKPAAWAFRFAILAKRLDGSKCRDCDTKQSFSSTAIAVTPACVIWPSALTYGTLGELLCPHLPECTCVFPRTGRSVSQRKPIAGNGSYES